MDGGRRLLRPLKEAFAAVEPSFPAYAGTANELVLAAGRPALPAPPRRRVSLASLVLAVAATRGTGMLLALVFFACVFFYAATLNGQYAGFVAAYGAPEDFVARTLGFRLKSVTILGQHELTNAEILAAAGIKPTHSLVFLDAARLRERLKALPLIKEASVSKLYPNRLLIEVQERRPIALWQKDGEVQVIATDGTPIDGLHDPRYFALPRAVGEDANAHIGEYLALLDMAGDLKDRIEAGIYVAGRRWSLKFKNGIEVALPEKGAAAAVAKLVRLEHDDHVLEKDVVALDLRIPGRLIVTLPDDVAHARLELLAHPPKKAGQT